MSIRDKASTEFSKLLAKETESMCEAALRQFPETKITDWELCYGPDLRGFGAYKLWIQRRKPDDWISNEELRAR